MIPSLLTLVGDDISTRQGERTSLVTDLASNFKFPVRRFVSDQIKQVAGAVCQVLRVAFLASPFTLPDLKLEILFVVKFEG